MKVQFCHLILFSIVVYLTAFSFAVASLPPSTRDGTPFCGVSNWQPDSRRYARTLANLDIGEPRTVRLIYFLPNDRPFRAEVAQRLKDEIRNLQTFFAKQMGAHGYGRRTFSLETDARGEPMVHRVNGQHPDSYYITAINVGSVFAEVESAFDANSNVYLIVLDNSTADLGEGIAGLGTRYSKNGGDALVTDEFEWWVAAHELGHAFGLKHDFRDGAYIMSYGPGEERLSKCSAEFLVSHPYLNPAVPIEEGSSPTIEPVSPLRYPAGSKSISLQFKIGDSDGIHQALLFVETVQPHLSAGDIEVKACHGLRHDRNFIFNFEYDGVIPSDGLTNLSNPTAHPITVGAVDAGGNFHTENFILAETSRDYIASLEGHTDWVDFVSFSHDGKTLASGALDGAVRLWDVEMETSIIVPVPVALSVSLSPNGRTLALGSWDGRVTLWNVATRQNIATLEAHIDAVSSVSFAPDGKTLASGARMARSSCGTWRPDRTSPRLGGIRIGLVLCRSRPTGRRSPQGLRMARSSCGTWRPDRTSPHLRRISMLSVLYRLRPMDARWRRGRGMGESHCGTWRPDRTSPHLRRISMLSVLYCLRLTGRRSPPGPLMARSSCGMWRPS